MNIRILKIDALHTNQMDVATFIDTYLTNIHGGDIVVISAKIIALCQGVVAMRADKHETAIAQAEYYMNPDESKYHQMLTVSRGTLLVSSGIDESNVDDGFIMLPNNVQKTAWDVRAQLVAKFGLKNLGVLIVDSASRPLRIGTVGTCLASAGIVEVKDYRGQKDVFGREIMYSRANHTEALAAICVAMMGEGAERTPLAIVTDVAFVEFKNTPTNEDASIEERMANDLFAPLIISSKWKKGGFNG